ncbi:unnamed protein product [Rotaria sp. Silwood2]|nr:unnamed protein product [Rotaria sp. Silwood2]CAF2851342.1 unnamed protein product [Rotaria sp. Silwood2]CAF3233047.1 unnamed protein product [Rotaria sp. Silwood2]CAF4037728.1 unnamed protein product [Rotaria sp. Silwood2]CAF4062353.1 unnamed protein product [Rotaria sp. Silwood2]
MTGTIQMYAGNATPALPWLLCDGRTVSRITFQRLFAVIGTAYGFGDNNTTFNVRDFRGRVAFGVDPSALCVSQPENWVLQEDKSQSWWTNWRRSYGYARHTHSIPSGTTGIRIDAVGDHTHVLTGDTGSVGNNQQFDTISLYQTVHYIIYSA